jgi:hypothetical protein
VSRAEGIVFTFSATEETAQSPVLAQAVHGLSSPGQDLVGIGLVTDVPYQPVVRGIEDRVQGDGQFYRAQAGSQVTASGRNGFKQALAYLIGQLDQLRLIELTQIRRCVDLFEGVKSVWHGDTDTGF